MSDWLSSDSFASDLVGTGVEFALISHSDEDGIRLLRSIQRKISSSHRAELLFPGAGRQPTAFDYETWKQQSTQPR
jgi:hypothetical protein